MHQLNSFEPSLKCVDHSQPYWRQFGLGDRWIFVANFCAILELATSVKLMKISELFFASFEFDLKAIFCHFQQYCPSIQYQELSLRSQKQSHLNLLCYKTLVAMWLTHSVYRWVHFHLNDLWPSYHFFAVFPLKISPLVMNFRFLLHLSYVVYLMIVVLAVTLGMV